MSACPLKLIVRKIVLLPLFLVLAACETNLGTDDLRVVNSISVPTDFTWYAQIDIPIEIAGGEGGYSVRYIQNPEPGMSEADIEDALGNNPVRLSVIKEEETTKNTFRLQGLPVPFENETPDDLDTEFWLEITDGSSTIIERYDFFVEPIDYDNVARSLAIREGEANLSNASGPAVARKNVCSENLDVLPEPVNTPFGRAFPALALVKFTAAVDVPITFDYEIIATESPGNTALPNVDFIPDSGQLVFEPGVDACSVVVYILDDFDVESSESISVVLTSVSNVVAELADITINFRIEDDEPELRPFDLSYVVAPGQSILFPVVLLRPAEDDVLVPFSVNSSESTIDEQDFAITPGSRVLAFNEGQDEGEVGVSISNSLVGSSVDPKLVIEFQGDNGTDGTVEVVVNSFSRTDPLVSAVEPDFVSINDLDGTVAAVASFDNGVQITPRVYIFDGNGDQQMIGGSSFYSLAAHTGNIVVRDVVVLPPSDDDKRFVLVTEVESNLGGTSWGNKDFMLVFLELKDDGSIIETSRSQHGSEEDDEVLSVYVDESGNFVIAGSSGGTTLDGEAVVPAQNDSDGFVYRFFEAGSIDYRRFVGNNNDNSVVATFTDDVGMKAVMTDSSSGIEVRALDVDGAEDLSLEKISLRIPATFDVTSIEPLRSSLLALTLSAEFEFNQTPTPSLTQDVLLYTGSFGDQSALTPITSIATSADDFSVDTARLEEQEVMAVVGDTFGEFQDGAAIGLLGDRDAFFASVDYSSTVTIGKVTQFGTPGNDFALYVEASNEQKFLVLWKEDHTSGDGSFRYRVTPFAPDGTNLEPLF